MSKSYNTPIEELGLSDDLEKILIENNLGCVEALYYADSKIPRNHEDLTRYIPLLSEKYLEIIGKKGKQYRKWQKEEKRKKRNKKHEFRKVIVELANYKKKVYYIPIPEEY